MTGLFLVFLGILSIIFWMIYIWRNRKKCYDNEYNIVAVVCTILFGVLLMCIPMSRIDSKSSILKVQQMQITIDESRKNGNITDFERFKLIESITSYNEKIAEWKTKSDHWYNNKWYLNPECKNVDFIK